MSLFAPGKIRVSLYVLGEAAKTCKEDHKSSDQEPIITDLVILDDDAGQPKCFLLVEFEYHSSGSRAGYGITHDGKAELFYN